jgi:hypothetical protein
MDDDAERVLAHLTAAGGACRASANLDPQWNAATAEEKHRTDLALVLHDGAGLGCDRGEVWALLERLADRGLVALSVDPEGAAVRLTPAGREGHRAESLE